MEIKSKSSNSKPKSNLPNLIAGGAMSGAIAGSISGGVVFLGFSILLSLSGGDSNKFSLSEVIVSLVFAFGLGALPGLIAGFLWDYCLVLLMAC
jgi:hypothetical protein